MADTVLHSIMGGFVEKFLPGDRWTATVHAAGAATGGRLVAFVAGHDRQVDTAGADSLIPAGVALHTAAAGEEVTVACEGIWPLYASAAITAGQKVKCAADGKVAPIAADVDPRLAVGYALADIAQDATGPCKLTL